MIEMRWVWHNMKHGAPPTGAVCVDTDRRLYQKLQYRTLMMAYDNSQSGMIPSMRQEWTPWLDVQHSGVMHPNAIVSGLPRKGD